MFTVKKYGHILITIIARCFLAALVFIFISVILVSFGIFYVTPLTLLGLLVYGVYMISVGKEITLNDDVKIPLMIALFCTFGGAVAAVDVLRGNHKNWKL